MILRKIYRAWEQFFFAPLSPRPIALFRILYGLCVCATLLLLHSDWLAWFGVHGWVTLPAMTESEPGLRLNLFHVMPQNDHWIAVFFWIFLAFAVLLTLGLWTRISSIAVFLCIASMQQRNLFITHGGDTFLRVAGFFLMFATAGGAFSVDRFLRVRRGLESGDPAPRAPWAQRMIQFELALLYFASFLWKIKGNAWRNGTALYYVLHLHEIHRFPIPAWMDHMALLRAGTWATLALECSLGILIWFRPFRYPLLLLGLLLHLCLEYALNIPMFQWDVLAAYVLFIDPADLERFWNGISDRIVLRRGRKSHVTAREASETVLSVD
jgi:Vitamin K-dependent gamma-carboxylase